VQEWWDSLFANYNNDSSEVTAEKTAAGHQSSGEVITNGFCGPSNAVRADKIHPMKPYDQSAPSVNSTAAVLRLSSALQRAPAEDPLGGIKALEQGSPSRSRKIPPPTLPKGNI
jgi:hypothetical protein